MSEEQRKTVAKQFFNSMSTLIENLASRWQDEKQYEDIADYKKVIDKAAKKFSGVKVTEMTKRPFGFFFTLAGCTYQVKCTMTQYGYLRIA